jgi:hypothetical protein
MGSAASSKKLVEKYQEDAYFLHKAFLSEGAEWCKETKVIAEFIQKNREIASTRLMTQLSEQPLNALQILIVSIHVDATIAKALIEANYTCLADRFTPSFAEDAGDTTSILAQICRQIRFSAHDQSAEHILQQLCEIAEWILNLGINSQQPTDRYEMVDFACMIGKSDFAHLSCIQKLKAKLCQMAEQTPDGNKFVQACKLGELAIIIDMLSKPEVYGLDPKMHFGHVCVNGDTPLMILCASRSSKAALRLLHQPYCNATFVNPNTGKTALHFATGNGDEILDDLEAAQCFRQIMEPVAVGLLRTYPDFPIWQQDMSGKTAFDYAKHSEMKHAIARMQDESLDQLD